MTSCQIKIQLHLAQTPIKQKTAKIKIRYAKHSLAEASVNRVILQF